MRVRKSKLLLIFLFLYILSSRTLMVKAEEGTLSGNSISENKIADSGKQTGEAEIQIQDNTVLPNSVSQNSVSQNGICIEYSGKCGEDAVFEFDKADGTLKVRGNGFLFSYANFEELPWSSYYEEIRRIQIGNGIRGKLWYFAKKYDKGVRL